MNVPVTQRLRRQRGSAVVEMAIIAPIAFLLLIGVIEYSILFYTTLTMQYAVREGARYAVTGRTDKDPAASNQQRYLAVVSRSGTARWACTTRSTR
jgi:Flp pilus assembly protein TadG